MHYPSWDELKSVSCFARCYLILWSCPSTVSSPGIEQQAQNWLRAPKHVRPGSVSRISRLCRCYVGVTVWSIKQVTWLTGKVCVIHVGSAAKNVFLLQEMWVKSTSQGSLVSHQDVAVNCVWNNSSHTHTHTLHVCYASEFRPPTEMCWLAWF